MAKRENVAYNVSVKHGNEAEIEGKKDTEKLPNETKMKTILIDESRKINFRNT